MTEHPITSLPLEEKRALLAQLLRQKTKGAPPAAHSLSYNQQPIWFLQQLEPDSSTFNLSFAARVRSAVNVDALKQALQTLIDRHEALRTVFSTQDGEPQQLVLAHQTLQFAAVNARDWSEDNLTGQVARACRQPFELETGPLLRVTLFTRSDEDHVLLMTIHHLVCDGWSVWLLLDELRLLYAAQSTGVTANLPPVQAQYTDQVQWQRKMLAGPEGEQLAAYWHNQLNKNVPALDLPFDYEPAADISFQSAWQPLRISQPLLQQLKDLARDQGVTLYMLLLAAYQILLHRYTGQNEIVIGSPMFGRSRARFMNTVGCFMNPVLLQANLSAAPLADGALPFRAFLSQVKERVLGALEHQDYPLHCLAETLWPERSTTHAALYQAEFILQKPQQFGAMARHQGMARHPLMAALMTGLETQVDFGGLSLEHFDIPVGGNQVDISLEMIEAEGNLFGKFHYNTHRFDAATIARMTHHLQALLAAIATNRDEQVRCLSILSAAERRQILKTWNETQPPYEAYQAGPGLLVHHLFEAQASQQPDAAALLYVEEPDDILKTITYADLNRRANQAAHHLRRLGVGPEVCVALCLERSPDMIVAMLAILKAGGAYVPLDPSYPPGRLAFMLTDTSAPILLTQSNLLGAFDEIDLQSRKIQTICLDEDWPAISRQSEENVSHAVMPDHLAYVMYTSGSTGQPKGVMIEHRSLTWYAQTAAQQYGVTRHDRVLQFSSVSFDISVEEIFPALTQGAVLALRTETMSASVSEFYANCRQWGITALFLPTAFWHELAAGVVAMPDLFPESLRVVCFGGEKVQAERLDDWQAQVGDRVQLLNSYGPTETTVVATLHQLSGRTDGLAWRSDVIGGVIPGAQLYILDRYLQPAPIGVSGEIYIGGMGVARGYHHRPELTAEKFIEVPLSLSSGAETPGSGGEGETSPLRLYKTGDLGRWLPDGAIEFLGRVDSQIKIRGFRVELEEIEAVLNQNPAVHESVVLLREDAPDQKQLVAYVTARPQSHTEPGVFRAYLQGKLPPYMVPTAYVTLDELPLTPNGKLDRRALPPPAAADYDAGRQAGRESTPALPGTPVEEMVSRIWAEVLGLPVVGVYDNFFELGGHSLLAMQMTARLRQAFGVEIPLRPLFALPTVAGVAKLVEQALETEKTDAPPVTPVSRAGHLPLAFSQERMWFVHQLQPEGAAYNIPIAARLSGTLDMVAFQRALETLIQRHESLRTTFITADGLPVQHIASEIPVVVTSIDLRNLPGADREQALHQQGSEHALKPFNLAEGPLFRVVLFQLGEEDHVMLMVIHHIIFDAWSVGVLVRDFATLYEGFVAGKPNPLPDLPIQFADFAHWQRQWFQGETLAQQLAFWREHLAGTPVLSLPTDRPRPAVQTSNGALVGLTPDAHLLEQLRTLSRKENATSFMVMLAAFNVLLYRYSGQVDFAVGTPIANRHWLASEDLIGTLVNTLALRVDLSGDPTFRDLIERARHTALDAYAYQDLPFEKLVAELDLPRDLSHSPLFQVMFDYINVPSPVPNLSGLTAQPLDIDRRAAQFDITLAVIDTDLHKRISLEYNSDLFDAATIRQMLEHFHTLLREVVADPDRPISQLPLLSEAEAQRVLVDWNNTYMDFPRMAGVHHLVEAQAARSPDKTAIIFEGDLVSPLSSITYRHLNERANQLATHLQTLGVGPDTVVGLYMRRSVEMVVALLGVLKAGGAYLPLDPGFPMDRLAYMVEDSGASVIITQEQLTAWLIADLPEPKPHVVCIDSDWDRIAAVAPPAGEDTTGDVTPDNLAYIIYTSGSTGKPKGVEVPHRTVVNFLTSMAQKPGLTADDILLSVTTLSFDISVLEIFLPLICGAQVYLVGREIAYDGHRLARSLAESGASVMQATPATWRMLIESGWSGSKNLKTLCGGEALPRDLAEQMLNRVGSLWNMYGPTETTVWSTVDHVLSAEGLITIGYPIGNTQIYILDQHMQPLPTGVVGDLYIGGDGVARGYHNRPELTAERFIEETQNLASLQSVRRGAEEWGGGGEGEKLPPPPRPPAPWRLYKTGDLARYLPDGRIEFLGRVDLQVKIRGFRIELGEIETAISRHPAVRQVVVAAAEDKPGLKRLVAYLAPEGSIESLPSPGDLRHFLLSALPDYMIPSIFMTLESLPLTPNGKINRLALPKPQISRDALSEAYVAPRTPIEADLTKIWANLLNVEQVGVEDDFFALGGHSLLATQLVSRIRDTFDLELPLQKMFEAPSVAGLALLIANEKAQEVESNRLEAILAELDGLSDEEVQALLGPDN